MSSEIAKRDENHVTVLCGITDDSDQDITMLRVDPITKRLLVNATGLSSGVTSLNGLTGAVVLASGTGITLTPVGNTITIASSVTSPTWYQDEIPTGTKDGVNVTFTLAHTPTTVVLLYVNGIAQNSNAAAPQGADYTRTGTTITMTIPPLATDNFVCTYS